MSLIVGATITAQAPPSAPPSPGSPFVPMVSRWSVALSAPPAGSPVIVAETIVVPLQNGRVVALSTTDAKEIWQADLPIGRPISADADRVYVPSADAIQALDLATGVSQWRAKTGALTAPPLVYSGWVVAAAVGNLSAFRATDGAAVWQREFGTVEFRPAIDGDLLYVPLLEGPIVCLNLQTGETVWETQLGGSPGEPMVIAGKLFVGAADKYFYVLDATDGEFKWRHRVGAAPRGRAAADDEHVYLVALDNMLRALDRGSGAIRWRNGLKYRPSEGPLMVGGGILVPGAIAPLPVFGPNGSGLTALTFPATVVAFSNVFTGSDSKPTMAAVTGDLEHAWMLWFFEPSTDPPPIPLAELKELPGETIVMALPE